MNSPSASTTRVPGERCERCERCARCVLNVPFLHTSVFVCARTKALVLELLAAVCLVRGGHEMIIAAFNNFKVVGTLPLSRSLTYNYFKQLIMQEIRLYQKCMTANTLSHTYCTHKRYFSVRRLRYL